MLIDQSATLSGTFRDTFISKNLADCVARLRRVIHHKMSFQEHKNKNIAFILTLLHYPALIKPYLPFPLSDREIGFYP